MIEKFSFGTHVETGAVVAPVKEGERLPYFSGKAEGEGARFFYPLHRGDIVYGLGETMRGINKRGGRYVSFNSDNPRHNDDMPSLYASHNFLLIDGEVRFGAFFDTPARAVFDIDLNGSGKIDVKCERGVTVYIVEGASCNDIARQFLSAIGRSYLPPLWAFGFGQSRWGYKCEKDVIKVADGYEKSGMPLDYICLDIDYMDRYIDFTVNKKRFPDMKGFVQRMKKRGIRLVPIVDAGIKIEPGNAVFDEGVEKGYYCKNLEGKNFSAAVWPGLTHFPDFLKKEARDWFGRQYKFYTDLGFEGFWNDMNEPAIFYSEYSKGKAGDRACGDPLYKGGAYLNDYKSFTHDMDGETVPHWEVHNLFGAKMTQSSSEGLQKLLKTRFLLFSRSSYIGAHRYGGIWTGDNNSSWLMLRRNFTMLPGLNLCGFLYSGADTGGFGGNCSRELLLRWLALSCFTPLMRDHTTIFTRRQECYRYAGKQDFKAVLSFRYRILPYLYSEYMKAALAGDLLFRPLSFAYPTDEKARIVEDELLFGESILIAPVMEKGAKGRKVYLPEDMTEVRWNGKTFTETPAAKGEHFVKVPLNEIVFYIRKGKCVPVSSGGKNTSEVDLRDVSLLGDGKEYTQYLDDGLTRDCTSKNLRVITK